MINLRTLLAVVVFAMAIHGKAIAQIVSFDGMLEQLENYAQEYPQEKVYLHLDKPHYAAGEDVWFKAYVTIGQFNLLSGLSKILYVDLINPQEQVTKSLRLPLLGGVTVGDFSLADTLSEGSYRIRAYTNWMRNFEEELFYHRTVPIGNALVDQVAVHTELHIENSPEQHEVSARIQLSDLAGVPLRDAEVSYEVLLADRSISKGKTTTDGQGGLEIDFVNKQPERRTAGHINLLISRFGMPSIRKQVPIQHTGAENSIQFFAEGGHLVGGAMAKVAFKALRPNGRSIAAHGIIRNAAGEEVAAFETMHAGMGHVLFHAVAGEQYTADVTFADGSTKEVSLPTVEASGYALTVNNENEQTIYAQLFATEDLVQGQTVNMLLQRNGAVLYGSKSRIDKGQLLFSIPREHLPTGVAQLTFFTDDMVPILERSLFHINPSDLLPLTIAPDREIYGAREPVSLSLESGLAADTMRVAVLSASVVNEAYLSDSISAGGGILAELLLRSELKGYIEDPGYYFEGDLSEGMAPLQRRALDNLMLTQGWSRIDWQALVAGQLPELQYKPEEELRVSGLVTRAGRKVPVPNATVTLLSTAAGSVGILDTITGPDGRFSFDRLLFLDSTNFVVQARDERGRKHLDIILDEVPRQSVTTNVNAPEVEVNVSSSMSDYLMRSKSQYDELVQHGLRERAVLIEAVEIRADPAAERRERLKHSSNLNGPGQADQVIMAEDLMSCSDLSVCLQGRLVGVIFRNGVPYSTRSPETPMTVIMDGMEMSEGDLQMISPFDVEAIEVLRGIGTTSVYGSRGGGGVIIVTTKRGSTGLRQNAYTPGVVTHSPQGYYQVREFYSPDYAVADSLADVRDLRTTIHWEPHIVTDNDGKAEITFYTADEPGVYRVVLEGLDVYGRLGRTITTIRIEE